MKSLIFREKIKISIENKNSMKTLILSLWSSKLYIIFLYTIFICHIVELGERQKLYGHDRSSLFTKGPTSDSPSK